MIESEDEQNEEKGKGEKQGKKSRGQTMCVGEEEAILQAVREQFSLHFPVSMQMLLTER